MSQPEKPFFAKKYVSFFSLFVIFIAIFAPTFWINFYEIPKINMQISDLKSSEKLEVDNNSQKVFEKRFELLESKYIDVIAAKDTINFWMTFLLFIFTLGIGGVWWQKNRMDDYVNSELKKIEKNFTLKNNELDQFKLEYQKNIKKYKKQAEEDVALIKAKYETLKKDFTDIEKRHNNLEETILEKSLKNEINNNEEFDENETIQVYIERAIEYLNIGKFDSSIDQINEVLNMDSNNTRALILKGFALLELGEYDSSIGQTNKVLNIDSNNIRALILKGSALGKLGRHEEEIECFDKVLKLDSENIFALHNKGVALGKLGKHEEAIECFDKVLELDLEDIDALKNKGVALSELGRHEEEIECFDKVLKLDSENIFALHNIGVALSELGRHEEAIECFDKVLEIDSNNTQTIYNLSCAYSKLDNKIEAIEKLEKAFELGYFDNDDDRNHFYTDSDFDPIKDTPEFKAFLKKLENKYGKPNSENQKTE